MNYKEIFKKMEQAGWNEIDLKDDFDYYFAASIKGMNDKSEQLIKAFKSMTPEQQNEFILKRASEMKEQEMPFDKDYERVHLSEGKRNVEFFTEGEIKNNSNHKCFALASDIEPDLTNFKECGFIKNVLFLKIENDEVVDSFIQFAVNSSLEQKQSIMKFLNGLLK